MNPKHIDEDPKDPDDKFISSKPVDAPSMRIVTDKSSNLGENAKKAERIAAERNIKAVADAEIDRFGLTENLSMQTTDEDWRDEMMTACQHFVSNDPQSIPNTCDLNVSDDPGVR
ncbi:MAG: hypothetical protein Q9227_001133 [Pyrenula ochraceoflavens]